MKRILELAMITLLLCIGVFGYSQTGAIRINQLGYYTAANKIALVFFCNATTFDVVNVDDDQVVFSGNLSNKMYWSDAGDSIKRCDFSALTAAGTYKIRIPDFGESYPFEISNTILREAAYASLRSYYYQRSSYELTEPYAGLWTRPAGHPDTNVVLHASTGKSGTISSPGGWYDAGDYGKYVINAGISVATLLSFYENFNGYFADGSIKIPESGNGVNDLLDEVKFELDWLKTMQDTDGGVFFKLSTLGFAGDVMPDKDLGVRYAIGKSTSSALDFAAMMAMAGRIYIDIDSIYAVDCIQRAKDAWVWAKANPAIYFTNPTGVSTGEYGDTDVSDEFVWAAAELYITTDDAEYKTYLEGKTSLLMYYWAPGWQTVKALASLSLATQPNGLSESLKTQIKNSIVTTTNSWVTQISSNAARIPTFSFNWGSNSSIGNMGVGMLYAYLLTDDLKYVKGAAECVDYLLGKNATGFSFVTSYGKKTPMKIHHRPSYADGIVQPIPGFVSGGPNIGKQDGQTYPFANAAKCFVDVYASYASNEVCINWNSPMTALFAGVDAIMGDGSTFDFQVPTTTNNPPTISVTSPTNGGSIGTDQSLLAKGTASDADGISKVELYLNSRYFGESPTSPFELNLNGIATGSYIATFLAFDTNGLTTEKTQTFSYYPVISVPALIEAENYYRMSGITTQTTTDEGGGLNVTSIATGDYIDYSINVQATDLYRIEYRVASLAGGGQLELRKLSTAVISAQTVPKTNGSQTWVTISDDITLTAGKQTVRLYAVSGGWNINWINIKPIPTSISDQTNSETGVSITVAPNPVKSTFTVKYNLAEISPVEFVIYDSKGVMVSKQILENVPSVSGEYGWALDASVAPGEYFIVMAQKGKKQATVKVVKAQ